jgi:deoxyhypusine synthase
MSSDQNVIPAGASAAVLQSSESIPDSSISVNGPNFEDKLTLSQFLQSYERIGFQATSFGKAVGIVNRMVRLGKTRIVSISQVTSRGLGVYRMTHLMKMNQIIGQTLKSALKHDVKFSWDTLQI